MFKFFKKLFENNEPEVIKHLYKLSKTKPYIIDNFKFGYDDMRRLIKIYLVDGLYELVIFEVVYKSRFFYDIKSYKYVNGPWDKHLIETINEYHKQKFDEDRQKLTMEKLNRLNTLEHFERLFERKEPKMFSDDYNSPPNPPERPKSREMLENFIPPFTEK